MTPISANTSSLQVFVIFIYGTSSEEAAVPFISPPFISSYEGRFWCVILQHCQQVEITDGRMVGLLMNWEGYGSIHGISEIIPRIFL
jgi:hypothetical protein